MTEPDSPFIETGVDPLLAELPESIGLRLAGPEHPDRPGLQAFIGRIFRQAHGAEVSAFYPNLLEFSVAGAASAVVGYRSGSEPRLFAEQYLDLPAHREASAWLGQTVAREEMVEVGNLAIADPGQARWIISASTAFLAAAGYRWVLFTATRPLANAFRRLGLKPLALAPADPGRLPDGGASWGDYYKGAPMVYLGDIHAGCGKLRHNALRHASLERLLRTAHDIGARPVPDCDPPAFSSGGRP